MVIIRTRSLPRGVFHLNLILNPSGIADGLDANRITWAELPAINHQLPTINRQDCYGAVDTGTVWSCGAMSNRLGPVDSLLFVAAKSSGLPNELPAEAVFKCAAPKGLAIS
jgi:hypothetical protein